LEQDFMIRVSFKLPICCMRHFTGVNILHDSGLSNEQIASVTGHKNPNSVQRYIRTSTDQLRKVSSTLSSAAGTVAIEAESSSVTSTEAADNAPFNNF